MQPTGDSGLETQSFITWVSDLRIKTVNCSRTVSDALGLLVILIELGKYYDGISYLETFKPKIVTHKGKQYAQAVLRQSSDLLKGVYFPCSIDTALISFDGNFEELRFRTRGDGFYDFQTPFKVPKLEKIKLLISFEDVEDMYYEYIPFTLVSMVLNCDKREELSKLPDQTIFWPGHNFRFTLVHFGCVMPHFVYDGKKDDACVQNLDNAQNDMFVISTWKETNEETKIKYKSLMASLK